MSSGPARAWLVARRVTLWLPIALVLGSCATLRVGSDYDRHVTFAGYRSFAFLPREHYGTSNPLTVQHAHDAIQAALIHKGFRYANAPAAVDFVVDFTIGARERIDVQDYPVPYAWPWGVGYQWWGYPYWGHALEVSRYREGTLSIDVFDARTHRPVWHGWAKKALTGEDLARSEAPIRAAVDAVLDRFPPQ
jgi:Domain of unknown function (DUF4136)